MFAIALWTESRKPAGAGARPHGHQAAVHRAARRGPVLRLGAETIFVHPEIERRLSLEGLDCYLSLNYVPAPWTLVEGIEKLRPGYVAGVAQWASHQRAILAACRSALPARWTLEAAKEEFDSLLRQSVREHLLSDVPLGVWLSGGIDSSTILHYAATASRVTLEDFFDFVPRAQLRRDAIHPRGRPRNTGPITRSSTSTRSWTWRTPSRSSRITSMSPTPMPARCRSGICRR